MYNYSKVTHYKNARKMSKKAGKHVLTAGSKAVIIGGNGTPLLAIKYQPNAPCRCGSGNKTKRCCGTANSYANSKPHPDNDKALQALGYATLPKPTIQAPAPEPTNT